MFFSCFVSEEVVVCFFFGGLLLEFDCIFIGVCVGVCLGDGWWSGVVVLESNGDDIFKFVLDVCRCLE